MKATTPTEETHLITSSNDQDEPYASTATRKQDRLKTVAMVIFSLVLAVGAILKGIVFANKGSSPFSSRVTAFGYRGPHEMMDIIHKRMPNVDFNHYDSPQSHAIRMLHDDMYAGGLDDDAFTERYALIALRLAMQTYSITEWAEPNMDHCFWKNVLCDGNGNVVTLELQYASFGGYIPPEIGLLSHLEVLDLSHNFMAGTIPSTIGNLVSMEKLELNGNFLSGKIPSEIGKMTRLKFLALEVNQFTGDPPIELQKSPRLTHFTFGNDFIRMAQVLPFA